MIWFGRPERPVTVEAALRRVLSEPSFTAVRDRRVSVTGEPPPED